MPKLIQNVNNSMLHVFDIFQNLDCGVGEKCVLRRSTCIYPPCSKYPICIGMYFD